MDFVAVKDLKAPALLRQRLEKAGEVVVTNNGHPMAVMVSVEDASQVEIIVQTLRQARARIAITRIRESARLSGADKLSLAEIDAEVKAVRRMRKR